MNHHDLRITLITIISFFASTCHSHMRWEFPTPRSQNDGIKTGPCGNNVNFGNNPTVFAPGKHTLLIQERITHVGSPRRIALSQVNSITGEWCILLDHIQHHNQSTPQLVSIDVTLPDIDCNPCVLQVISVMVGSNNNLAEGTCDVYPGGTSTTYHSCADIVITGKKNRLNATCGQPTDWPYRAWTQGRYHKLETNEQVYTKMPNANIVNYTGPLGTLVTPPSCVGQVRFSPRVTALTNIQVWARTTSNDVTVGISAPIVSGQWISVGIGTSMGDGQVIMYDGTQQRSYRLSVSPRGAQVVTGNSNPWTTVKNVPVGTKREIEVRMSRTNAGSSVSDSGVNMLLAIGPNPMGTSAHSAYGRPSVPLSLGNGPSDIRLGTGTTNTGGGGNGNFRVFGPMEVAPSMNAWVTVVMDNSNGLLNVTVEGPVNKYIAVGFDRKFMFSGLNNKAISYCERQAGGGGAYRRRRRLLSGEFARQMWVLEMTQKSAAGVRLTNLTNKWELKDLSFVNNRQKWNVMEVFDSTDPAATRRTPSATLDMVWAMSDNGYHMEKHSDKGSLTLREGVSSVGAGGTGSSTVREVPVGNLPDSNGMMFGIKIEPSRVVVTIVGKNDRWFGVGFNTKVMTPGRYALVFTNGMNGQPRNGLNTYLYDMGVRSPSYASSGDAGWNVTRNDQNGNVRTVEVTRSGLKDANGPNFDNEATKMDIIWGHAGSNSLSLSRHGQSDRGSASIDLVSGRITANPSYVAPETKAHGSLMWFAWGIFVPIGLVAVRHRGWISYLKMNDRWFNIHRFLMLFALLFVFIACVIQWDFLKTQTGSFHGVIGLMMFLIVCIHALIAWFLRPDKEDEKKRRIWYLSHSIAGYGLFFVSFIQIFTGIGAAGNDTGVVVSYTLWFLATLGVFGYLEYRMYVADEKAGIIPKMRELANHSILNRGGATTGSGGATTTATTSGVKAMGAPPPPPPTQGKAAFSQYGRVNTYEEQNIVAVQDEEEVLEGQTTKSLSRPEYGALMADALSRSSLSHRNSQTEGVMAGAPPAPRPPGVSNPPPTMAPVMEAPPNNAPRFGNAPPVPKKVVAPKKPGLPTGGAPPPPPGANQFGNRMPPAPRPPTGKSAPPPPR